MILALDQSMYTTGWAVFNKDCALVAYGRFSLPAVKQGDYNGRARNRKTLVDCVATVVKKYKVDLVIVEGTFQNKNPQTFASLSAIKGCIEDYCIARAITCFEFKTASEWRKVLGYTFSLNGVRLKSEDFKVQAKEFCLRKYKVEDNLEFDTYEAIAIGNAYITMTERKTSENENQSVHSHGPGRSRRRSPGKPRVRKES